MRKKTKIILASIIVVAIIVIGVVLFFIMIKDEKSKFVGTWTDQDGDTHHFFSDGTFNSISGSMTQSGTWELKDNLLVFITSRGTITYSYSFSNNDNTLTMSGPKTMILTKQ